MLGKNLLQDCDSVPTHEWSADIQIDKNQHIKVIQNLK